ncbi:hypothetical protein BB559_002500 [Furculomyces boomerangus]|uniref:Uncharacterized protein n=2 Tax=Harpellales TaxID=61421 RepID=A0A2T9YUZ4_9FUNG|nr:hypothetical protein BB559_002500 [Furculomyces boomerangus]PWA02380.1 hypothetical protein BB558_001476 [Smittium angustum]
MRKQKNEPDVIELLVEKAPDGFVVGFEEVYFQFEDEEPPLNLIQDENNIITIQIAMEKDEMDIKQATKGYEFHSVDDIYKNIRNNVNENYRETSLPVRSDVEINGVDRYNELGIEKLSIGNDVGKNNKNKWKVLDVKSQGNRCVVVGFKTGRDVIPVDKSPANHSKMEIDIGVVFRER